MNLKEFLTDLFKITGRFNYGGLNDYMLMGANLELFKSGLRECDEFSGAEEFEIIHQPVIRNFIGGSVQSQTMKINSGTRFTGSVKLYSISLTPETCDLNLMYKPVHEGASISPTTYDETTFTPRKTITMTWLPELAQDVSIYGGENNARQQFHDLLDRILDHPTNYQVKGFRGIMVRGIFTADQRYLPGKYDVIL